MLIVKPLNSLSVHLSHLVKGRLWLKVIIGLVAGSLAGILINPDSGLINENLSQVFGKWLNLPATIFMKLVQMVMIPLIIASIISGLVSNVSKNLKSFGLSLFLYFIFTTVVSVTIGIIFSFIFNPGTYAVAHGGFPGVEFADQVNNASQKGGFSITESIGNLIPVNPLESMLTGELLSVVIFTVIIGVAITQLDEITSRPIVRFIEALQKICMTVIGWAMRLIPFAVFGLMAALVSATGTEVFLGLGYYMMVVMAGLFCIMLFYCVLYIIILKQNPLLFLHKIKDPLLLAFSTASSAAVMPLSMKTADEKLGVSSKVSDFVIPIGATINMDGTALFQCVTVLFMAQVYGVDLDIFNVLLLTATVVSASIGTPAIPGGGVIILTTVLQSTGIPPDGLIVIIGIDRILGMFRTAVNVTGDLTATVIFNKFFGKS